MMDPMIEVAGARVFLGDCVEVMRSLPDNSVDSIVTDPPYGLEFMGKEWDAPWKKSGNFAGNVEPTSDSAGGVSAYASARVRYSRGPEAMVGFQLWATEWAVECLRVLKPGGHILAFGGSRTWHRLAVAVEDAGFELRDSIAWIYGSGFPKSLDVSKAIDKKAGAEREVVGYNEKVNVYSDRHAFGESQVGEPYGKSPITSATTSEAKAWQGWGTALKPAFEPVVVGRKPLVGTVAENVLLWGVGGLNIDGSRIGYESDKDGGDWDRFTGHQSSKTIRARLDGNEGADLPGRVDNGKQSGRWPANVILDEVSAGLLDEQSGVSKSPPIGSVCNSSTSRDGNILGAATPIARPNGHGDTGGASRFFYVAKASKRDRNEGLEDLEARRASAMGYERGLGDAGEGMFKDRNPQKQNFHPTVKPTQLMRYLIKLVTPEGGVVLDPFTGSGSTGKAALLDGFEFIGAELTEEYLPIIEGRLRWAVENQEAREETLF